MRRGLLKRGCKEKDQSDEEAGEQRGHVIRPTAGCYDQLSCTHLLVCFLLI